MTAANLFGSQMACVPTAILASGHVHVTSFGKPLCWEWINIIWPGKGEQWRRKMVRVYSLLSRLARCTIAASQHRINRKHFQFFFVSLSFPSCFMPGVALLLGHNVIFKLICIDYVVVFRWGRERSDQQQEQRNGVSFTIGIKITERVRYSTNRANWRWSHRWRKKKKTPNRQARREHKKKLCKKLMPTFLIK